jgi:hypothetical protein
MYRKSGWCLRLVLLRFSNCNIYILSITVAKIGLNIIYELNSPLIQSMSIQRLAGSSIRRQGISSWLAAKEGASLHNLQ